MIIKKWFKDNTLEHQKLTKEVAKYVFGIKDEILDVMIENSPYIVIKTINTDKHSIQIAIADLHVFENNSYLILVFNKNDELVSSGSRPSHVEIPQIWNRVFGMEYIDYLILQDILFKAGFLENIDIEPKGCMFNLLPNGPEAAKESMQKGELYEILSVFAEKKPDMVEKTKEYVRNKLRIKI